MSNALAIAAVTTTLRSLLDRALDAPGVEVTTLPPDKARTGAGDQVNLFLYQMSVDAALRNAPAPRQSKPGETAEPPLALNLFYLVTAYGANDNDALGHRLLGQAMSALHDHPLLDRDQIRDATFDELPDSDLHTQVERVRITWQPLGLEDLSKLWTTFQTQFRISAAYQVSAVLIESTRAARTPLPVLGRASPGDAGPSATGNVASPFPAIHSVAAPDPLLGALPGQTLSVGGVNLAGTSVAVRIRHSLFDEDLILPPLPGGTAAEARFVLPAGPIMLPFAPPRPPAPLPAGFYTVALEVVADDPEHPGVAFTRTTNRLAFPLAPDIVALPASAGRDPEGRASLTLTVAPPAQPEQVVSLLLDHRQVPAQPRAALTDTLTFEFTNPTPAQAPAPVDYFVRVRVDGIDSALIDRAGSEPVFRNDRRVTIT
ncbi:MAG TPA: DUF4255 domain-containing protein [Pyrinomonadaceae bacterium]|nr:DUF4255 domain-containing protein [Pyrinomonadaceae bacterium]